MPNSNPKKAPSSLGNMVAIGMALGLAFGVGIGLPFGVAVDRIEIGLLMGITMGPGFGVAGAASIHVIRDRGKDS